jgi:hypothetical protein
MLRMYSRDRVGPAYKPAMRKGKEAENAAAPTTPDAAPVEEAAADSSAEPAASEEASAGAEAEASTPETPAKRPDPFDLRASPKSLKAELDFVLPDYAAPFIFVPPYLEVHYPTASAVYVRAPTAGPGFSEVPTPWEADGDIVRMTWVCAHVCHLRQLISEFRNGTTRSGHEGRSGRSGTRSRRGVPWTRVTSTRASEALSRPSQSLASCYELAPVPSAAAGVAAAGSICAMRPLSSASARIL